MRNRIEQLLKEGLNELQTHHRGHEYYHGSIHPKIQWSAADENLGWATEGYGLYLTPDKDQAMGYAFKNRTDGFLHTLNLNDLNMLDFNSDAVPDDIIKKAKSIPEFFNLFYVTPTFEYLDINDLEHEVGDVSWSWDLLTEPLPKWAIEDGGRVGWFLVKHIDGKGYGNAIYGLSKEEVLPTIKKDNSKIFISELDFDELYRQPDADGMQGTIIRYDEIFNKVETLYWYLTLKYQSLKKASLFFKKAGLDAFMVTSWGHGHDEHFINLINPSKIIDIKSQKVSFDEKYLD